MVFNAKIADNINAILSSLKNCPGYGHHVKLIAVSKTKPIHYLLEAFQAGQRIFGENKVQEAKLKRPEIPNIAEIHLIGPLQANKAKYCPRLFSTIHTLTRFDIAETLEQRCLKQNVFLDVLIQMNLSDEKTKHGLSSTSELKILLESLLTLKRIRPIGLMTIPNPDFTEKKNAKVYQTLYQIREQVSQGFGIQKQFTELSMGMSADYQIAIAEGATYIRIGSAIFGERDYALSHSN